MRNMSFPYTANVIGTCGHELAADWFDSDESCVAIKDYTREGGRAVSYNCVCPECKAHHEKEGAILKTEQQESEWLDG